MEIISILISPIIAIMFNRLRKLLIIYSTLPTIYVLLKLRHPELQLRKVEEWTLHNLFNGYNFWIEGILWFLTILFLFYLVIPKILYLTLLHFKSKVKITNPKIILDNYINYLNLGIRLAKITNYKFHKSLKKEEPNLDEYTDKFILFFSMSLHISLTMYYFLGNIFLVISLFFLFVLLLFYSGLPTVYSIFNQMIVYIKEEVEKEKANNNN